jgi:thiamine biosynthesis lipoprotein
MRRREFVEKHLGTPVRLVLVGEGAVEDLAREAFYECARIEKAYSRFLEGNELAALNAQVGEWAEVSAELYELIAFGEDMKRRTQGAFDLSVKSILEGWGYDSAYSFVEGEGGRAGDLEMADGRVRLTAPIELGGLGKGYAIDRVGAILAPIENFLIDAGGDLLLRGCDDLGAPWRIAFEHPTDIAQAIGIFEGSDLALACSSPSRRSWGKRHHLVDPRSGEAAGGMLSVYTQAPTALVADAYSTALFVLGFEAARELLSSTLRSAPCVVEALLVGPRGEVFRTPGFAGELFT